MKSENKSSIPLGALAWDTEEGKQALVLLLELSVNKKYWQKNIEFKTEFF